MVNHRVLNKNDNKISGTIPHPLAQVEKTISRSFVLIELKINKLFKEHK